MNVIGIQIEPFGIYAVTLHSTSQGITVKDQTFLPLSLEEDDAKKRVELSAKLKILKNKYPAKENHFVFSYKNNSVHDLQFPFREKFKINKAIHYEMEKQLPFDIKNTVYSPKICYFHSNFSHVLSFVSSKKEIEDQIQLLSATIGKTPHLLIPESIAIANLFEDWKNPPPDSSTEKMKAERIHLYLSYENSFAVIESQQRMIHAYDIHWNLKPCIQDISAKYQRSIDQAFSYFRENALIANTEKKYFVPLLKIMKHSVTSLTQQLQLLLLHLKGHHHTDIQEIFLYGLGSQIQNLPAYLFQKFHIPFRIKTNHPYSIESDYAGALGVALEGLKKPKNPPVDWLKHFQSSSEVTIQISQKKRKIFRSLTACLVIFFSYIGLRNWKMDQLTSVIDQSFSVYARKIAQLKTRNISVSNVKKFLQQNKEISTKNTIYNQLPNTPSAIDQLKRISFAIDQPTQWKLELNQLSIDGSKIQVMGSVLENYLEKLQSNLKTISMNGKIKNHLNKLVKKTNTNAKEKNKTLKDPNGNKEELASFHFSFQIKN